MFVQNKLTRKMSTILKFLSKNLYSFWIGFNHFYEILFLVFKCFPPFFCHLTRNLLHKNDILENVAPTLICCLMDLNTDTCGSRNKSKFPSHIQDKKIFNSTKGSFQTLPSQKENFLLDKSIKDWYGLVSSLSVNDQKVLIEGLLILWKEY